MRVPFIVFLLATVAAVATGCTTTGEKLAAIGDDDGGSGGGTDDGTGGGDGSGDGDDGGSDSGGDTAGPKPTPLSAGDAAYAFNANDMDPSNDQLAQLTVDDDQAMVLVDPKDPDMKWPEPIPMDRYTRPGQATSSLGGSYREYRSIVRDTTDAELQLWNFDHSYAAQYRVWEGGNADPANSLVVFYGGDKTPAAEMPSSGTATYNGKFGATATASNWLSFERSVPDEFAIKPESTYSVDAEGNIEAETVSPNGEWRVTGDTSIAADFGAGSVAGTIDNMRWRKYQPDAKAEKSDPQGYINLTDAEGRHPFPRSYQLDGSIEGSDYGGSVATAGFVPGANAFKGSFFGPGAAETTGIMHHQGTAPNPSDGMSPNEEARRGYVDIRGVFNGR